MSTLEEPATAGSELARTLSRAKRCIGTRKDGGSCGAPATSTGPFCLVHDPDRRDEARQAQRAGGLARRLPRAADVLREELERIAREQAPALLAVYTDALEATKLQSVGFEVHREPDHAVRLKAADSVLDRALGRPPSALELTGRDGGPLTLAALLADDPRDTI